MKKWVATAFGSLESLELVEGEVAPPGPGEVTIEVRAVGMNPTDFKGVLRGMDASLLPLPIGYEVAGVIAAIGAGTEIASGGGAVGDAVLAFRVRGGYATAITMSAGDVFAKPASLDFPAAANLLLAGTTAAEMRDVARIAAEETILVHGASGAVGVSVLQQAREIGARVIGTASEHNFDVVRGFGGYPVAYGPGLEQRVRELAPVGIAAALDCVGTDEAVDASLALVADRGRIVTIAAAARAAADGIMAIGGGLPASGTFRAAVRTRLIDMAASGRLVVPIARTFPFTQAREALEFLSEGHPGGKLALIP